MTARFFVPSDSFFDDHFEVTDPGLCHQLTRVLRMEIGDEIILCDGMGLEYQGIIETFNPKKVSGKIVSKSKNENEPEKTVVLYQAMPKKMELFELVLQKGTEIGVKKFVPLITERTERLELSKLDRLHAILKEAAEQSGRALIPELLPAVQFKDAIMEKMDGGKIVFDPSGEPFSKLTGDESRIRLFVGPEGGFSKLEIELAKKSGAKIISLGKLTLRTETAGIVGAGSFLLLR